jgi:hypothetical protein
MKVIDIFKIPIVLTYKKDPKFSTGFSTVVSVATIFLILVVAVFFSQGIYAKIK